MQCVYEGASRHWFSITTEICGVRQRFTVCDEIDIVSRLAKVCTERFVIGAKFHE